MRRAAAAALACALAVACDPPGKGVSGGATGASDDPSAVASILPAPLADPPPPAVDDAGVVQGGIPADSAGRLILPDAGPPPPEVLRPDVGIPSETPTGKELAGVTALGAWRWRDVPAPPKAPEVDAEGIKAAHQLTALTWKADLAETGRLRVEFTSRALPLPARSELRARADRYGHIVMWPNFTGYRVIAPGALRTVMRERRVDVTPLSAATPVSQGQGKRLGLPTRKLELSSSVGVVRLEVGKLAEAGEGGALLCRALVEIGGVDPKTPACQAGEVPLSASYAWADGGGIAFEVTEITKRVDLAANDLLVPPPGTSYAASGLPEAPSGIFLTREEVAKFRSAAQPLPAPTDPQAPGEGFVAVNQTDALAYLLIDGVPVVAVPASSERYVIGTTRGKYLAQWRTFLGDKIGPPVTVEMPARIVNGAVPDAGVPDAGR